jgi:large-conductance mechanosensitive channel
MADNEGKPLDQKTEAELKREAKARLKRLDPIAAAAVMEESVKSKVAHRPRLGFTSFLREKGIVGLAVGFVIGSQVQVVVKGFIADFIDPFFKLVIPGNQTLSQRTWAIYGTNFKWGDMAYQLLDFLFILLIIFLVIKFFKLDQLDKKS